LQVKEAAKICAHHRAALRIVSGAWRNTRFEKTAFAGQLQDALARETTIKEEFAKEKEELTREFEARLRASEAALAVRPDAGEWVSTQVC
jgi:predicted GIY-YIG superfamily endonuclease